jgi:hypothetical protein
VSTIDSGHLDQQKPNRQCGFIKRLQTPYASSNGPQPSRIRIGREGEICERTTEGQHFQIAGLNLLNAIIIYWNSKQPGIDVGKRKRAGLDCSPELLAHISSSRANTGGKTKLRGPCDTILPPIGIWPKDIGKDEGL